MANFIKILKLVALDKKFFGKYYIIKVLLLCLWFTKGKFITSPGLRKQSRVFLFYNGESIYFY